jgi:hypothetical protein
MLQSDQGLDEVIAQRTPLPTFDMHAPLSSVPAMLGRQGLPDSTHAPYLFVEQTAIDAWRLKLDSRDNLMIGLSWAGCPHDKLTPSTFMPLDALAPFAHVDGIRLINLQVGPEMDQLLAPPRGLYVDNLFDERTTLTDIAALSMCLDLIITVDTTVAHLAGGLGKPVWNLLPQAADWRWPRHQNSPQWYPTMRLYRQSKSGDWSGPIERVSAALRSMTEVNRPNSSTFTCTE